MASPRQAVLFAATFITIIYIVHGLTLQLSSASTHTNGHDSGQLCTHISTTQSHADIGKHPLKDVHVGTFTVRNEAVHPTLPGKSSLMEEISEILSDCDGNACRSTGELLLPFFNVLETTIFYIDKTLLIEKFILSEHAPLTVTAPSQFGKTVNLKMMQAFFQRPITANGTEIKKEQSVAYKIFKKLKIGKSAYFDKHFGSRPVIYFDFMQLHSFNTSESLSSKLHKTFQEAVNYWHPYLSHSADDDTVDFRKRCLSAKVPDLGHCLSRLGMILRSKYKIQSLVLIDECSVPFQFALSKRGRELPETELEDALSTVGAFFAVPAKKYWLTFFWRVYATGIMRFGETNSFYANNLIYKSAFQDVALSSLYGFTQSEVEQVAKHFGLNPAQKSYIQEYFDGYDTRDATNSGKRVFCAGAVMKHIMSGCARLSREQLGGFFFGNPLAAFENLLSPNRMGSRILESLKPGYTMTVPEIEKLTLTELTHLRDAEILESTGEMVAPSFFYYMMENGLYSGKRIDAIFSLTIPNEAARVALETAVLQRKYFDRVFKCTDSAVQNFTDSVKELSGSRESVESLTKSIVGLFSHPGGKKPGAEFELAAAMYTYMVFEPQRYIYAQLYVPKEISGEKRRYIDILYQRQDGMTLLIETRHSTARDKKAMRLHSSRAALADIITRNYTNIFERFGVHEFIFVGVFMNETICQCSTLYNTNKLIDDLIQEHTEYF